MHLEIANIRWNKIGFCNAETFVIHLYFAFVCLRRFGGEIIRLAFGTEEFTRGSHYASFLHARPGMISFVNYIVSWLNYLRQRSCHVLPGVCFSVFFYVC